MKIASWNVNSLNVRLPHLQEWLRTAAPDVLALQETKLEDSRFPIPRWSSRVIAASSPARRPTTAWPSSAASRRATCSSASRVSRTNRSASIAATVGDVRIVNLYVVNGQAVGSEKYDYKLRWIDAVHGWLAGECARIRNLVVLGDFNIAPDDRDVHDPRSGTTKAS